MDLTKELENIGLTGGEVKVYLSLLELETSTTGPIFKKAKVPESKIYSILEKLQEKGLVSFVIKNNVKHYSATMPDNLIDFIEEKRQTLQDQKEKIKNEIIPKIEAKKKTPQNKTSATVYEGMKGIKSAFTYMLSRLKKGDEYFVFSLSEDLIKPRAIHFFQDFHKKRAAKKVKVNFIAEDKIKKTLQKHYVYPLMKRKYSKTSLPVGTLIFNGHVMTMVWGENPTTVIIESQTNYQRYLDFFKEVWKSAS